MWLEWLRSLSRAHTSPRQPQEPPSPRYFSCSSFKDINAILLEEQHGSKSQPQTPRRPSIFHRASPLHGHHRNHSKTFIISPPPNQDDHEIILYFTSLGIVRKTFEDCRTVRSILRGFRVPIDERDLSMDAGYLDEIQMITGSKKVRLPAVFLGGKYVGGAEEIKEMNESGELSKLIGGLPFVGNNSFCDVCGELRYVLCAQCNGSHKIYSEKHRFRTCTSCNVNGLVKCGLCYPVNRRRMST
uniref:Glutaredoxin domain-containing protein n=1 Tax=Manihot esculenta TaxID=3983 RepID=A0A2C9VSF4_MANES